MAEARFRFSAACSLDGAALLESEARRVLDALALPAVQAEDLLLALHEALCNSVVHGQPAAGEGGLVLEVESTGDDLELRVTDSGCGFQPELLPDPLAPGNLTLPSGRGLLLMRNLVDAVGYRRDLDGMTVRLRQGRS